MRGDCEGESETAREGEVELFGEDAGRSFRVGVVGDDDLEAGFGAGGGTSASEVVLAISPKKRALGSSGKVGMRYAIDFVFEEFSSCESVVV